MPVSCAVRPTGATSPAATARRATSRASGTERWLVLSERDFQRLVTDAAAVLGWSWVHFRPAQTSRGWRTPVSGPLGAGWCDLVLVRAKDRRALFVELKAEAGKVSEEQRAVMATLADAGQECYVWRPSDFDSGEITKVLA